MHEFINFEQHNGHDKTIKNILAKKSRKQNRFLFCAAIASTALAMSLTMSPMAWAQDEATQSANTTQAPSSSAQSDSINTIDTAQAASTSPAKATNSMALKTGAEMRELATKFGRRADVEDISLSPDGKKIVMLVAGKGSSTSVYWTDLSDGALHKVIASSGKPDQFFWCEFSANDRLVCMAYGISMEAGNSGISFSRMISLGLKDPKPIILGNVDDWNDAYFRHSGGSILDWLENSGELLMSQQFVPSSTSTGTRLYKSKEGMGVVRLNSYDNKSKTIEEPNKLVSKYLTDGENGVRIKFNVEYDSNGYSTGQYNIYYREKDKSSWQLLNRFDDNARYEPGNEKNDFWPIKIDHNSNRVFGLMTKDGREALYSVTLDANRTYELVYAHDAVDISGLKYFGQGSRAVGVRYTEDRPKVHYFDSFLSDLHQKLSSALPGNPNINFLDASLDENRILLSATPGDGIPTYYIFDKVQRKLEEVLPGRMAMSDMALGKVQHFAYQSRDGANIPAYITLPPGMTMDKARNLPVIVYPHGGPTSRDTAGFDWIAQYFAQLGYVVMQPNYRGSSGYGDAYQLDNAIKNWRTAMNDINDGSRWLIEKGIADPDNISIVGWSYGGYAALQTNVMENDLYKAAVAIAPVTDWKMAVDQSRGYTNYKEVKEEIGSMRENQLYAGSPLRNADKINVPVMLFHGDHDLNVNVSHSKEMEEKLKKAGKNVTYFEYKDLDHNLSDSDVRKEMLVKIAEFLEKAQK